MTMTPESQGEQEHACVRVHVRAREAVLFTLPLSFPKPLVFNNLNRKQGEQLQKTRCSPSVKPFVFSKRPSAKPPKVNIYPYSPVIHATVTVLGHLSRLRQLFYLLRTRACALPRVKPHCLPAEPLLGL